MWHFEPRKTESLGRQIPVVRRMPVSKNDYWDTQFLASVSSSCTPEQSLQSALYLVLCLKNPLDIDTINKHEAELMHQNSLVLGKKCLGNWNHIGSCHSFSLYKAMYFV